MKILINSLGLFFDILGAIAIFKFGIPKKIDKNGHQYLILEQIDDGEKKKAKKYEKLSYIGLTLIIIGFIMQLIGNLIK